MPINARVEYYLAEKKFREARSREEKIKALEEMIRYLPKHKGTENLLALLRKRLSKLKSEKGIKVSSKPKFSVRKEGSAQICIIGPTNSGKSSLLKELSGVEVKISEIPFTTTQPKIGMMTYKDVQLQLIEIPSTFNPCFKSILHTCDEIIVLLDFSKPLREQEESMKKVLEEVKPRGKVLWVVNKVEGREKVKDIINLSIKEKVGLEELKEKIWESLGLIKVYTKSPGKPKDLPAITLKPNSTVKDLAESIHEDFVKNFKFARIFDKSKFSGRKVGLDYKLKDGDVVEIHLR